MKNDEKEKNVMVVINGRELEVEERVYSFEEIVVLAFGSINTDPSCIYTLTYSKGHSGKEKGQMVSGETIMIKKGMIFNVTSTIRS